MHRPRLLIVEDEKIIAMDLAIRLRSMNYTVEASVSNGADAIDEVAQGNIDLVLMDVMIEGDIDGIETARRINDRFDLPIIFLTAYADEGTFQRAFGTQPAAYLIKPFQDRELDLTIRTVLQNHRLEQRLKASEQRYRNLFAQTREALLILDDEGFVVELNESARRLLHVENSVGLSWFDLFELKDRAGQQQAWAQFLELGEAKGRYKLPAAGAGVRYIAWQLQSNFLPGLHLAIIRNITGQVEARRRIELLARFPAEAPYPIMRVNLKGEVLYVNGPAKQLLTVWAGARNGQPDHVPPRLQKALSALNPNQRQLQLNLSVASKMYNLLLSYVPSSNYVNIYAADITRLKQSEKMEGYQRELLQMVARGNPLQVIMPQISKFLLAFTIGGTVAIYYEDLATGIELPGPEERTQNTTAAFLLRRGTAQRPTLLDKVLAQEEQYLIKDVTTAREAEAYRLELLAHRVNALLMVPIASAQRSRRACIMLAYRQVHTPSQAELNLINLAARVLAVALEREEALHQLYHQAAVFENIYDAVVLTNAQGTVTDWNPSASKMFGRTKEEMLGQRLPESGIFEKPQKLEKLLRFALTTEDDRSEKWVDELNFSNTRGEYGVADVSVIPLPGVDTTPRGTLCVIRDITARKRIEAALTHSEANLLALIENTEDYILSVDKHLRIVTANSAAINLLNQFTSLQLQPGSNVSSLLPEEAVAPTLDMLQQALQGRQFRHEVHLERQDEAIDLELSFNPIITAEGLINGVSVIARDITLRKAAENELKRTNFELDSFVYRSSHDLRAPLRSILGLVNILNMEGDENNRRQYLALIEKSVNKLDSFIADLTNFSRNNRIALKPHCIDLNAIIADCQENLRYMENAQLLHLDINLHAETDFYSEPQRLHIIFQNLISNAIKYMRPEAQPPTLTITATITAQAASIVVADNGKGIDPKYQPRLFEMFFRASAESYGSGLGLYITRQVVEKLGGKISFESELNQGTTFRFTLPNMQAQAEEDARAEMESQEV